MDLDTIKKKAIHGAVSITFGNVLLLAANFIVINIILARIFPTPAIIGTLNLATTIVTFFKFFSDIGLGASLIQKRDITEHDISTTFVVQEILVGILAASLFIAAPFIATFYHLDENGMWLIRSLAFTFFITSFRVMPSILLERNLEFNKIVLVDILETIIKNVLLVTLAASGYGLLAFAIAEVVRSVLGTVLLYNLSPWRVTFKYSKDSLRELIKFGVPYQTNQILAMLKDQLVPLVVARLITLIQMGYVTWGMAIAFIPLQIMSMMIRVTFPAYARLQDNRVVLGRAVERSLYMMALVVYPALFGILAIIPNLVAVVGAEKYGAAVPLVYLFSFATFWALISTTYTNVFNAVGNIKLTFRLMIMWVILEWALTPILVWQFGYIGVGISKAIISFSSIITIILMRNIAPINLIKSIGKPLVASAFMGIILYPIARIMVTSKWSILPLMIIGGAIYVGIMLAWDRKRVFHEVKEILNAVR